MEFPSPHTQFPRPALFVKLSAPVRMPGAASLVLSNLFTLHLASSSVLEPVGKAAGALGGPASAGRSRLRLSQPFLVPGACGSPAVCWPLYCRMPFSRD